MNSVYNTLLLEIAYSECNT